MQCKQACPQLALVSINSFLRSFVHSPFNHLEEMILRWQTRGTYSRNTAYKNFKIISRFSFLFFFFFNENVRENSLLTLNCDLLKTPLITALGANNYLKQSHRSLQYHVNNLGTFFLFNHSLLELLVRSFFITH